MTPARLVTIWEKVLGHKVGVTDNFFEIGGNSFLALRLGEEVGRSFSRTLPLGVIFFLPTIDKLAKYLDGEEQLPNRFSLVPLQTEGSGLPIFIIHWTVRDLVRHLGRERPIYALSFGFATPGETAFPAHVEDLATHYIEEMERVQPFGPYTLIGYSAGGVVAFEMAQQLLARGDKIDFLGMIDTYLPKDFFFTGERLPLYRQIVNMCKLTPREIYDSIKFWYIEPLLRKLHPFHWAHSDFVMSPSDFWMSYEPKPYPGKLTLFTAKGVLSVRNQRVPPERFWSECADGRVEVHEIPGRHLSVVYHDPHAQVLAAKLRACLHQSEVPAAVPPVPSQLTAFMRYCAAATGQVFDDYRQFDRFAVNRFREFWRLFVTWSGLLSNGDPEPVCLGDVCETASFFPHLRLNYAENLLDACPDDPAITLCHHDGGRERLTRGELSREAVKWAIRLTRLGVVRGDRVAVIARNNIEVVVIALACAAIGAVFASCPQDMSAFAILTRFAQLSPKVLLSNVAMQPWDIGVPLAKRVAEVVAGLPSLTAVVLLDDGARPLGVPVYRLADMVQDDAAGDHLWERYPRYPFNHPLFVLFSSGTTGAPKCIVHGAGGTLLEHLKEHRLHCDLSASDKLFFQTSCGWMMWNWQLSALACGTELVLYDGPLTGPETLWRIVAEEQVTVFGTSAAFLQLCQGAGYAPRQEFDLSALRSILSTGSILYPQQYDWVRAQVKPLALQSISGGTDIIGCFVLGNPNLPVRRGQAQCRSLALDVRALVPPDAASGEIGELVCRNPFPSRPLGFFGDDDGSRFHEAYFSQNAGVWTHGDLIEFTPQGGAVLHGRSDGVLNIRGIRVGPAEIYRILQDIDEIAEAMAIEQQVEAAFGGARLVLLVVLRPAAVLDDALTSRIRSELFLRGSTALIPARIVPVEALPTTHSGKRSEVAARDALNGHPVRNREALLNPETLDAIAQHPALKE